MDDIEFSDPTLDPQANTKIAEVLAEATPNEAAPNIPSLPDTLFDLPAGYMDFGTGRVVKDVEVRELTGRDEERIAKAKNTGDVGRWVRAILEAGTVSIGGQEATPAMLDELLVGDRDYLLMAIRIATYGAEIELGEWKCPSCKEEFEAVFNLRDIPVKPLRGDRFFEVPLRKGGVAGVHLSVGSDQMAFLGLEEATDAERNSVLLRRIVDTINGEPVAGLGSLVDNMGVVDRRNILSEVEKRMPGPRYDEAKILHGCGAELLVPLGLVSLFPGL